MIRLASKLVLMTAVVLPQSQAASYTGFAASYAPGVMTAVARHRGIAPTSCMVASHRLPLERSIVVLGQRTGVSRRCKVVDICAPRDCPRIRQRGIVVELDYQSNRAICGATREPPRYCPVTVWEVP